MNEDKNYEFLSKVTQKKNPHYFCKLNSHKKKLKKKTDKKLPVLKSRPLRIRAKIFRKYLSLIFLHSRI